MGGWVRVRWRILWRKETWGRDIQMGGWVTVHWTMGEQHSHREGMFRLL